MVRGIKVVTTSVECMGPCCTDEGLILRMWNVAGYGAAGNQAGFPNLCSYPKSCSLSAVGIASWIWERACLWEEIEEIFFAFRIVPSYMEH
jgi:hypothetical protein